MKKIKTSDITGGAGFPVKKGTLDLLQAAYTEIVEDVVRSRVGDGYDSSKAYILYGLKRTGTGQVYNVTAGALFFNGEVYRVAAFNFTATAGQTAVGTITTTNIVESSSDPVTFTDGANHNVHEIRTIIFADAISGSGDVNFNDIILYLEELDFVDLSSTLTTHASLTGVTKVCKRYKDGSVLFRLNATISADIIPASILVSGLPSGSGGTPFPMLVANAASTVYGTLPAIMAGTNIASNVATIAVATWQKMYMYFIYKKE